MIGNSFKTADRIVAEDGALAIFVDSGQNGSGVVGEEAFIVEVSGQELSSKVDGHVAAVVEAILVETALNLETFKTNMMKSNLEDSLELKNISIEAGSRQNYRVITE